MNLAIFGNKPIFDLPRSTSNLVQPSKERFLKYLGEIYNTKTSVGPNTIGQLEQRLASEHGTKYCVVVCNGLWGIVMAIFALKIEGKNEIIMPSLTYRRMADIAAWLGMIPHFCDVDYETLGVQSENVLPCINENTALILAPHPIVNLCDISGLADLSSQYKIPLLFDSVEASFAEFNGKKIGSFGNAECFSMHASKFLNGFEGGYITTNDEKLARKLGSIRNNGINHQGVVEYLGMDGGLIEPHAAMTLACLDEMDEQIERNKLRFFKYKAELTGIRGISLVEYSATEKRSYKNILVRFDEEWPLSRAQTIVILQAENMIVRPYYYPPLHKKENQFLTISGLLNNTELLMDRLMLLPCGEFVSLHDIETIVKSLRFLKANAASISEILNRKNE